MLNVIFWMMQLWNKDLGMMLITALVEVDMMEVLVVVLVLVGFDGNFQPHLKLRLYQNQVHHHH